MGSLNIAAVAAGYDHVVALNIDGTVWAWGNNAVGELGIGSSALVVLTLQANQLGWATNGVRVRMAEIDLNLTNNAAEAVIEVQDNGAGFAPEIALLPMIESAFNPVAYSSAHASGIWQFIPSTGRDYGLHRSPDYDARRDIVASTSAALPRCS